MKEAPFTKDQFNGLISLLERNNLYGTKHAKSMVRGESNSCYSAWGAGKYFNHDAKIKIDDWKWILEETYHICSSIEWFVSYSELVPPIFVTLPNGTNIQAHTGGKVKLHDKLVLEKVLYLPGFNINVIYVSRLYEKNNSTIVFEDDSCTIQERGTMKNIGLAKMMDDLYYLKFGQVKLSDSTHVVDSYLSRL